MAAKRWGHSGHTIESVEALESCDSVETFDPFDTIELVEDLDPVAVNHNVTCKYNDAYLNARDGRPEHFHNVAIDARGLRAHCDRFAP